MRFFPRDTLEWRTMEPTVLRRLSISLVTMAIITGIVLRALRIVSLHAPGLTVVFAWIVGIAFLAAFVTLHLGNYPLRQWIWRAPAFALIQTLASLLTSALFVTLGLERLGSTVMGWAHLASDVFPRLIRNEIAVCAYALLLAAAVQVVRRLLASRGAQGHRSILGGSAHSD